MRLWERQPAIVLNPSSYTTGPLSSTSTMHRSSLLLLYLALDALAQEPAVVTVFRFYWDERLAASVVSATPTATTYSLGCPTGQGTTCFEYSDGIPTVTIVAGPSTAAQTLIIKEPSEATIVVTCKLTATAPYGGPCMRTDRSGQVSSSTSFNANVHPALAQFVPITITGGLEKLQSAATGTGGGGGGSGGGGGEVTSPTGTGSGTPSTSAPTRNGVGAVRVEDTIFCVGLAVLLGTW